MGRDSAVVIRETEQTPEVLDRLISLSADWERENCCHGYVKNTPADIAGNRVFLAEGDNDTILGYLFGHMETAERQTSIYDLGTKWFEVEELYVRPENRDQGVGQALFRHMERAVADEAEMVLLGTASKNCRAILHFYIDELGMEFWSARLFKRLR